MERIKYRIVAELGSVAEYQHSVDQARKNAQAKAAATYRAKGIVSGFKGSIGKLQKDMEDMKGKHRDQAGQELASLQSRLRKAEHTLSSATKSQSGAERELARLSERLSGANLPAFTVAGSRAASSGAGAADPGATETAAVGGDYTGLEQTAWAEAISSLGTPCPVCRREVSNATQTDDARIRNMWIVVERCAYSSPAQPTSLASSTGAATDSGKVGDTTGAGKGASSKRRRRKHADSSATPAESEAYPRPQRSEATASAQPSSGAAAASSKTSAGIDRRQARRLRRQKRKGKGAGAAGASEASTLPESGYSQSGCAAAAAASGASSVPREGDGEDEEEDMESVLRAWAAKREELNASLERQRKCRGIFDETAIES